MPTTTVGGSLPPIACHPIPPAPSDTDSSGPSSPVTDETTSFITSPSRASLETATTVSIDDVAYALQGVQEHITRTIEPLAADMTRDDHAVVAVTEAHLAGQTPRTEPGTPAHAVNLSLQSVVRAKEEELDRPLSEPERHHVITATLLAILRNDPGNGPVLRWVSNVLHVSVGRGLLVAAATTLRQAIGFAIERSLQMGGVSAEARLALGVAMMAIGPVMNMIGGVLDEVTHTATRESRISRAALLTATIGSLAFAANTGAAQSALVSYVGTAVTYSMIRDFLQAFLPLESNAREIDLRSSAMGGAAWSFMQVPAGYAMDELAPNSGPGAAVRAAQAASAALTAAGTTFSPAEREVALQTAVRDALAEAPPFRLDDVVRGGINAVPEVFDDLFRPALARHYQVQSARARAEATGTALSTEDTEGFRVRVGAPRIPDAGQLRAQFNSDTQRVQFFCTIFAVALGLDGQLSGLIPNAAIRNAVVSLSLAGICTSLYPAFVHVHAQASPEPRNAYDLEHARAQAASDAAAPTGAYRRHV